MVLANTVVEPPTTAKKGQPAWALTNPSCKNITA